MGSGSLPRWRRRVRGAGPGYAALGVAAAGDRRSIELSMAGVEEQQLRLQRAVDGMVEGLEREHIRVMQAKMFRCSAECCEKEGASMQQVHNCIERCHTPMSQAQSVVTSELERFQGRLARCTMNCNDKAKDALDTRSKESQVKLQLENCVSRCADEHMNLIPSMTRKLKETLTSIPQ